MTQSRAWRRAPILVTLVAVVLSAAGGAAGQSVAPTPATISLISEEDGFPAGQVSWIGLLFELEQDWHIYWVNPGDAGDPPRAQWNLPEGFQVGEVHWPVPIRLVTGPVIDYGYEGRVLLAVPLEVPADLQTGAPVTIAADISYVICREVCISTKARATLLEAGRGAMDGAARRALFAAARARWPKPMPTGWDVDAVNDGTRIVLGIQTGTQESTATFFPLDAYEIDNAAPQVLAATPSGLQLTLQRSDPDSVPHRSLRALSCLGRIGPSKSSFRSRLRGNDPRARTEQLY